MYVWEMLFANDPRRDFDVVAEIWRKKGDEEEDIAYVFGTKTGFVMQWYESAEEISIPVATLAEYLKRTVEHLEGQETEEVMELSKWDVKNGENGKEFFCDGKLACYIDTDSLDMVWPASGKDLFVPVGWLLDAIG